MHHCRNGRDWRDYRDRAGTEFWFSFLIIPNVFLREIWLLLFERKGILSPRLELSIRRSELLLRWTWPWRRKITPTALLRIDTPFQHLKHLIYQCFVFPSQLSKSDNFSFVICLVSLWTCLSTLGLSFLVYQNQVTTIISSCFSL